MATPKDTVLFLPLGGSGEIGMNMNLYGLDGQWIMIDCGTSFAGDDLPGVDMIFPDPAFISERRSDLLGLVLTHAHEDHIGAVAQLWPQLQCPVFATPFTAGMLRSKLSEAGLLDDVPLYEIGLNGSVELGPFNCEFVTLAHSIAEPNALLIKTRAGTIFHTGDWKLDAEPVVGEPANIDQLKRIGDEGVLAMVCDSTNVFNIGKSGSEEDLFAPLSALLDGRKGRVAVTGFASNIARLHTLARVAKQNGRKAVLVGRSMRRNVSIAQNNGYLLDVPAFISEDEASQLPASKVMYICTGSQGEGRGAMARIARDEHPTIKLGQGDMVIFSSKVIPGNDVPLAGLYNKLAALGVEVITEKGSMVHVSGHPGRPDLVEMYGWIRPYIAIPVHGETRHLMEHAALAKELQVPHSRAAANGEMLALSPKGVKLAEIVESGQLVKDGKHVTPRKTLEIRDRRRVAGDGHLVITLLVDERLKLVQTPGVNCLGIPDSEAVAGKVAKAVEQVMVKAPKKQKGTQDRLAETVRIAARRCCEQATGKRPVTDVQIMQLPSA